MSMKTKGRDGKAGGEAGFPKMGGRRLWQVHRFKLDNKSIQPEHDQAFFRIDGTKLKCL